MAKRTVEEIKQSIIALQIEAMKRSGATDEEVKEFKKDAERLKDNKIER